EIAVLVVGAGAEQAAGVIEKLIDKVQSEPIVIDPATQLRVEIRATVTELAPGERSGEAALARCYGALRAAAARQVRLVASDERPAENDPAADTGALSTGTIV